VSGLSSRLGRVAAALRRHFLGLSQRSPGSPAIFIIPCLDLLFSFVESRGGALQSSQMRVLEAKDSLVQQTAEQAALENVSLSDLEKRMMYFTETDECPEDPIALHDAFEAEYNNDEYEAKISKLMNHAHSRIKRENPEAARKWKEAIRQLSKGDHYVLILCNEGLYRAAGVSTERPPMIPSSFRELQFCSREHL
jgi:hypothetical protein